MTTPTLTFDPTFGYKIEDKALGWAGWTKWLNLDSYVRIHSLTPNREHLDFIGSMRVRDFLRMRTAEAQPLAPFRLNVMGGGESRDVFA